MLALRRTVLAACAALHRARAPLCPLSGLRTCDMWSLPKTYALTSCSGVPHECCSICETGHAADKGSECPRPTCRSQISKHAQPRNPRFRRSSFHTFELQEVLQVLQHTSATFLAHVVRGAARGALLMRSGRAGHRSWGRPGPAQHLG